MGLLVSEGYGYGFCAFGVWWIDWVFWTLWDGWLGTCSGWFVSVGCSVTCGRFLGRGWWGFLSLGGVLVRRIFVLWEVVGMESRCLVARSVWVLVSSCVICANSGSNSPVRVYRRSILERVCARSCVEVCGLGRYWRE